MKKILTILAVMLSFATFAQTTNQTVLVKVPITQLSTARTTIMDAINTMGQLNGYLKDAEEFIVLVKDQNRLATVKGALAQKYGDAAVRFVNESDALQMLERSQKGLPSQPSQN